MPNKPITNCSEAIDYLYAASRRGRPIIPFLGAGISIGSGFPVVAALRSYFAKVKFYIEQKVYAYTFGSRLESVLGTDPYSLTPSQFLRDFGWPDFNHIDTELWRYIHLHAEPGMKTEWIDSPCRKLFGELYDKSANIRQKSGWGKGRRRLQDLVQFEHLKSLYEEDLKVALELAPVVWARGKAGLVNPDAKTKSARERLEIRGNWNSLLLNLTEGDFELVDLLFTSLGEKRRPALSHIFLAHLTRLMNIKAFLTVNFDTLLESTFRMSGLEPRVFDVSRDSKLPGPLLTRAHLSVLKVHGSSYGLRVGESLDHALDHETRERFLEIIPEDALILVTGFSGWERRMMQLIESAIARRTTSASDKDTPTVLWLHAEPAQPPPLKALQEKLRPRNLGIHLQAAKIFDAGFFLMELYSKAAFALPSAALPYRCLAN